jgi:tRNA threonylcarbamoyladenosine biosynthesis protein TsaB
MKVLALELSTGRGSVAWHDEECVERVWHNDRKNSGPLFENLKEMRETWGCPEIIVVGLGPGSYAGVRIAISAAIGLQAACRARLVGLPSICAIPSEARQFLVIGDARRQAFFLARIEDRCLAQPPELLSEAQLRTRLDGRDSLPVLSSDNLSQFANVRSAFPSAAQLTRLARMTGTAFSLPPLQPMYLREPHITMPKKPKHPVARA